MICVQDKYATLSGTCPGLCRKVGVMEFGLYPLLRSLEVNLLASSCSTAGVIRSADSSMYLSVAPNRALISATRASMLCT